MESIIDRAYEMIFARCVSSGGKPMAESDMRQTVNGHLTRLGWDPISVENRVHVGTPDVNYIHGWLELKWLRAWPKRFETVVRIEHWTPEQKLWIERRWRAGGQVHVLLQCRRDWLLFEPLPAVKYLSVVTKGQLFEKAAKFTTQGMTPERLEAWLEPQLEYE
jgi:hypothetical protein